MKSIMFFFCRRREGNIFLKRVIRREREKFEIIQLKLAETVKAILASGRFSKTDELFLVLSVFASHNKN